MPPPTLLVFRRTPPIQVYEQAPTLVITQDGNNVPSASTRDAPVGTTPLRETKVGNALCEAFGKRFLAYNDTIRERDEGGSGNWGIVFTFAQSPLINLHSGLVVCHSNGQEILACMYINDTSDGIGGANNCRVVFTKDGSNWTEIQAVDPSSSSYGGYGAVLAFRSQITWVIDNSSDGLYTYDFTTGVGSIVVRSGMNDNPCHHQTIVHKNKLLVITGGNDFPLTYRVSRLEGGSWTFVYRSNNTKPGGANADRVIKGSSVSADSVVPSIFTDPVTGDLIIIVNVKHSTNVPPAGFEVRQILNADTNTDLSELDVGGQVLDITDTVMPVNLRPGGSGFGDENRMTEIFVDNVTDPANPTVYWLQTNPPSNVSPQDQGITTEWYQWNGVGALMTLVGVANTSPADFSTPMVNRGGGERVKTSPAARPVWDGGILLTHGAVTSGPFLVDDVLTGTSGTAVVRTVYSGSLDVEITSGTFSDTESISGAPSGASATLTADSSDLGSPVEIPGGTTRVYFRVQGTGIPIDLEIRLSTTEDVPSTLMSLAATTVTVEAGTPATTPTNTTSLISNVTPDGGSTIYSVQLNTTAESIGAGQGYALMLVPV